MYGYPGMLTIAAVAMQPQPAGCARTLPLAPLPRPAFCSPIMGVIESNVQVSMYLPSLADVAEHPFPPGYSSRLYRRDSAKPNSGESCSDAIHCLTRMLTPPCNLGAGADAKAYHHIWEQADRRLWNDPELTLPDGWVSGSLRIVHRRRGMTW